MPEPWDFWDIIDASYGGPDHNVIGGFLDVGARPIGGMGGPGGSSAGPGFGNNVGTPTTPTSTLSGLEGLGSFSSFFGGDSGDGKNNDLFNLLYSLGLAQKGQGRDAMNTLFSGIEV